jgi:glycosyltransferase involved in cell wall biosynthesis
MKKIAVLHVIGRRPQGGIGTFLYNITKNIDQSKFQFDFLINASGDSGEFDDKMKALGSNVYVLPELKYKNALSYFRRLKSFYEKNHGYNIIHVHSANIAIFNYWAARKYTNNYFAVHSHSTKYSDKFVNSVRNYLLYFPVKRIADLYFACSNPTAKFMFGKNIVKEKSVHIIKNAINIKEFLFNNNIRETVRKNLRIKDQLIIGHVGAFVPVKNHEFIIDIFFEIIKFDNQAFLILVGTGELEEKIKKKVNELNLGNSVRFLGRRSDINELMQAFDVFLMPSKFEGVPLVGVEAQASGLPCVFSDSITKEIKIIEESLFVELRESPEVWAEKILTLSRYTRYKRRNTSNELIEAGYEIHNSAMQLQEIYSNLIGKDENFNHNNF